MRAILTCGGTGGHINPAIAIADTIRENCPRSEILFVGSEGGMENRLVPAAGYEIRPLRIVGLRRSLSPENFKALYRTVTAVAEAKKFLRAYAPDIVIGTGGYASFPTLYAACALGIPTAAHESNAAPGLAIRRLASRLDRIWLNFEKAAESLPRGKCLTVGNPLPREFLAARPASESDKDRRVVLSFGGSLGARELNRAVLAIMSEEIKDPGIRHLHASGKGAYEECKAVFEEKGLSASEGRMQLVPYIEDMPRKLAEATVVICRAGAMSISELAAAGKAAVLIPSPNVTGNHQYKNAQVLSEAGAAILLPEENLPALPALLSDLLLDREKRLSMERKIGMFFEKDCNRKIYEDILMLLKKHR